MYINIQYLQQQKLTAFDWTILILIRQNTEDMSETLIGIAKKYDFVSKFEKLGLVESIKGRSEHPLAKLRLSKKGKQVLENSCIPKVVEDDIKIYEALKKVYIREDKDLGNATKTKLYIALFRIGSGLERNRLFHLITCFIKDEKFEYSQVLEYLFFKPSHVFKERFDINASRLYQYYLKRQAYFDSEFSKEKYDR